jgi:hypothetical protein
VGIHNVPINQARHNNLETNNITNFEARGGFLNTQLITAVNSTAYKALWSEYARGL